MPLAVIVAKFCVGIHIVLLCSSVFSVQLLFPPYCFLACSFCRGALGGQPRILVLYRRRI